MTRRGWLLFAAMAVIWGVPYLLIKIAVAEVSPATLVLMRTALGAAILVPLAMFSGGLRALVPHWRAVLLYTFVEVAAPWILLSDAERRLSSSLSGLLIAGVPLVGALLAWLVGGDDRPDARRLTGLVLGFAGVAVLVGLDVSTNDLGAVAEVGLVVVGYAIGPMIVARRLREVPAVGVIAASLVLTAIAYAPIGVAQLPAHIPSTQALLAVVLLGVVCTAVGFVLFFELITEVGPNRATVITYFNPVVALALGVALLGEPLTVGIGAGFALIAFGSFVATRRAQPVSTAQRVVGALPPSPP
ncbi:MAG TPA: DMT family transporter [Candidatus Limnocylindria bacterium]|nr:DMT family transporter [Candidatus Limnocylindria bacterium]